MVCLVGGKKGPGICEILDADYRAVRRVMEEAAKLSGWSKMRGRAAACGRMGMGVMAKHLSFETRPSVSIQLEIDQFHGNARVVW